MEDKYIGTKHIVFDQSDDAYLPSIIQLCSIVPNPSSNLQIVEAMKKGSKLPTEIIKEVQVSAANGEDTIDSLHAKYLLCVHAAYYGTFVEPVHVESLLELSTTDNIIINRCILWSFAVALPCTNVLSSAIIQRLCNRLEDALLGWNVSFIFRKLSENEEYINMVSDIQWISMISLLCNSELSEQIRLNIIYTMTNIFKHRKEISNPIKIQIEQLIMSDGVSHKLLLTAVKILYMMALAGMSLDSKVLDKLRDLTQTDYDASTGCVGDLLDFLDNKHTVSKVTPHRWNTKVQRELVATQTMAVLHSKEKNIEPLIRFLSPDHLLDLVNQFNELYDMERDPFIVNDGDHTAWYRTTLREIKKLSKIAKQGKLEAGDFNYLLKKMKDGRHFFTVKNRNSVYKMIANVFQDAARCKQKLPDDVITIIISHLTNESVTLKHICAECILHVAHNNGSFSDEQIKKIEQIIQETSDNQIKQNLLKMYSLWASKGHHVRLDLDSVEKDIFNEKTCVMISFLFLKASVVEKRIFTPQQMLNLSIIGMSNHYLTRAREQSLLALAYSIKAVPDKVLIPVEVINHLRDILKDEDENIRCPAAAALCFYAEDNTIHLSEDILERLATMLHCNDDILVSNILNVYLSWVKQKKILSSFVLDNITEIFDYAQSDHRHISIWIMKHVVDNDQILPSAFWDKMEYCLNDEYPIRNTAAMVFIEYWHNQLIKTNDNINIKNMFLNYMEHLLIIIKNRFELDTQIRALSFLKYLVENNYELSESFLRLIECCLCSNELLIVTNAVEILMSYMKQNSVSKQTIATLENVLTTDSKVLTNVITMLKIAVCQGHILSDKSLVFLGNLLFKSDDPHDIVLLLTFSDRHQPLPNNVNDLLRQHYYINVLLHSTCSKSRDNAYNGLQSLIESGRLLSRYVLESLFILLKLSHKNLSFLSIIIKVTNNQQRLIPEHISMLTQLFFECPSQSLVDLIEIFTQLTSQNQTIPHVIIYSLQNFLNDASVNINIIKIYRHLIERQQLIDRAIIDQVLNFLNSAIFETISPDLQHQVIAFFSSLADAQPIETDQSYLPFLLDIGQPLLVRKNACLIAKTLIEQDQILLPSILDAITHLWHYDVSNNIKHIALNVLNLARLKTAQQMDKSVKNLLDLTYRINTTNGEDFLNSIRTAIEADFKPEDKHLINLSTMLYSCAIHLKKEAANLIVLAKSRGHRLSNRVLDAIYGTLRDETINYITIELLPDSTSSLSSMILNDLLYIATHSSHETVLQGARRILNNSPNNANFKQYLQIDNRSLMKQSTNNDFLKQMLCSSNDNTVCDGLLIVENMLSFKQQISSDILVSVTKLLSRSNEMASEILIRRLKDNIKLDNTVCETIEYVFITCRTKKIVMLIQILAIKRYIFKSQTLNILFDMLQNETEIINDLYLTLDYASQYQSLSTNIINFCIKQLKNKSNEILQRSFAIIHNQILQKPTEIVIELPKLFRLPYDIDQKKLFDQLETFEQCVCMIYTLLFVNHFDSTVFDLPVEQWIRECLCTDLLAGCSNTTSIEVNTFYHQLTLLEQYKQYSIDSNDRDRILRVLIRKQRMSKLTLSTINQVLIYLKTLTNDSFEIFLMDDSNWLINMRKYFVSDRLHEYLSNFIYSEVIINHLTNRISQEDQLSADLIEAFLRIVNQPQDIIISLDTIAEYQITNDELIEVFTQINNTIDFNSFLNRMKLIVFHRTFLCNSTGSSKQVQICELYLNNLLEYGWTFETISELLKNIDMNVKSSENLNRLNECLKMLIDYKIDESMASQLNKIFMDEVTLLWSRQIHACIIDYRFGSKHSDKTIATLLSEIQYNGSIDLANMLKAIDEVYESYSLIAPQNNTIKFWEKSNIQYWANEVFCQHSEQFIKDQLIEVMAVIKRAVQLDSNFELRHVQLIAVMIMLDSKDHGGRLLQILTGEGKSTVIAMLAVIKALEGKQVDIVTSSITLAKRDAHERKQFYEMFKMTVSHNNDEVNYVEGPKNCYEAKIVYGNSSQFQFDILRNDFSLLNTRKNRPYDIVIIDEVDSMLIDENNIIARLADQLPSMEWLNPLLYAIWQTIQTNADPITNRDRIVKDLKKFLGLPESPWKIPRHLECFVVGSIPCWIDNAISAKVEYRLDHHYIIKPDETRTKRILPIDYSNTGVIQCNTTWDDGLHQFLQLKHGLKMTPLSIATNYLSNIGLFTHYKDQIYGFSGTLEKRHCSFKPILTSTDDDWLDAIVSSTIDQINLKRAVLIICQTRLDAKTIFKALRCKHCTNSMRFYTDNTDDIELSAISNRVEQSEIIVATNLVGRGTDLKTSEELEKTGGLHICLTYLPNNLRIEQQAFGRTSRQGNRGTSQMILNRDRVLAQLICTYPEYMKEQHESYNDPIDLIRDWQSKAESSCLDTIWKEEIPIIKEKDHLFEQFCILLNELREQYDNNYQLSSVKERWGLWLKSIEHARQNQQKLQNVIEIAGFSYIDVQHRDGNSFFNVLSQQLGGQKSPNIVKQIVIEHMLNKEDQYEILTEESRYIAASQALNVNIVLYRNDYGGPYVYKCENAIKTCFIGYEVDTHYISLQPLNSNDEWIENYLFNINSDCSVNVEHSLNTTKDKVTELIRLFVKLKLEKKRQYEEFFLTKIIDLNIQNAFKNFQVQIQEEYNTDQLIQNPCYLLLESEALLNKHFSANNRIQSIAKSGFFMKKKSDPFDKTVDVLKRAIDLDPIFSFSAYVNYAHIIIHKRDNRSTYKVEAKSKLLEACQQIDDHILSQHYIMKNPSTNGIDEIFFDDFAQQTNTKIFILESYKEYIKRAVEAIERSQNLIDVYADDSGKVYTGRHLYREKAQEFLSKSQGIIDLSFHDLKVTRDIRKNDQAIQLLELLPKDKNRVTIHLMNPSLKQIKNMMSKANLNEVCLVIENLDHLGILQIINNDRVDLMVTTSKEQYQKMIENFSGKVTLAMDSFKQDFSPSEALKYLESTANNVNSIMLKSIDRETINNLLQQIEQAIFTLTFNDLPDNRIDTIITCISEPFSIYFKNLSKEDASKLVGVTDAERNMILDLHGLTKQDAKNVLESYLKKIGQNEHDIRTTLKNLADLFSKSDQPSEELNGYANMGVQHILHVKELNPRPWISTILLSSIGIFEIICGICVILGTTGIGFNIGMSLAIDGINNIIFAIQGTYFRTMSWTSFAKQKSISLLLSFVSCGISSVGHAAHAALSQTHNASQLFHNTFHGTVNMVRHSVTGLHHNAAQHVASYEWGPIIKQMVAKSTETCIKTISDSSLLTTTQTLSFQMKNPQNEFCYSNYLLGVIATLTNKPISVIQQQIINESIPDMRIPCNAFIEANPVYATGMLPIIQNRNMNQYKEFMIEKYAFLDQSLLNEKSLLFKKSSRNMAEDHAHQMRHIINWLTSADPYLDIELKTLNILYPQVKLLEQAGFELHHIYQYKILLKDQLNANDITLSVIRQMLIAGNIGILIYCSYQGIERIERLKEYQNVIEKYLNDASFKLNSVTLDPDYDIQIEEYIPTNSHVVIIYMCEHGFYHYVPGKKDILKTDTIYESNMPLNQDDLAWYSIKDERYMNSNVALNTTNINSLSDKENTCVASSISRYV
ncbi:unnamed protein product [Rotaria sp. Silwood2]|nr:unnamed protein product [Rotaria sp. Silwood2]